MENPPNNPAVPVEEPLGRHCIECGYNLHGLASDRCPECGSIISTDPQSPIPWQHRQSLGRIRAFWRTMMMAMFRPAKLAAAVATPVDASAARRFRLIVVVLATLPAIGQLLWKMRGDAWGEMIYDMGHDLIDPTKQGKWWQQELIWTAGATFSIVVPIAGFILAIFLATAAPRRLVDLLSIPLQFRVRGSAASDYLCAPLVWLTLSLLCITTFLPHVPSSFSDELLMLPVYLIAAGIYLLPLLWWLNTIRFEMALSKGNKARGFLAGLLLPVGWAIAIFVGLIVMPMIVGLLWLIIDSVR